MVAIQFVDALGGINSDAALLGIKPPSVSCWSDGRDVHQIPVDKLIRLTPIAEVQGIARRKYPSPDHWSFICLELASKKQAAHG